MGLQGLTLALAVTTLAGFAAITNGQTTTPCERIDGLSETTLTIRIPEVDSEADRLSNPNAYQQRLLLNGHLTAGQADTVTIQLSQIIPIKPGTIDPNEYFVPEKFLAAIYIRLKKSLDRDGPTISIDDDFVSATYRLTCTHVNTGNQKLYDLTILLDDSNDNSPYFLKDPYVFSIPENSINGVPVGTVSAEDIDEHGRPNSQIAFTLDDDFGRFAIADPVSGEITVNNRLGTLDYETQETYVLNVIAKDFGLQPTSTTSTVTVSVTDINDNIPLFIQTSFEKTLIEGASGLQVATVQATDKDSQPNIVYILTGAQSSSFQVDQSGNVITLSTVDYESRHQYIFYVTTEDGKNSNDLFASATVTVNVLDVNDNAPVVTLSKDDITILETSKGGTILSTATATDADAPGSLESRFSFKIIRITAGANALDLTLTLKDRFLIDPINGNIILARSLAGFQFTKYEMTIAAEDFGTSPMQGTVVLVINVIRNLNAPVFPSGGFSTTIDNNLNIDASVLEATATDADTQAPYNELTYQLIGDARAPEFFQITNPSSPLVTVKASLLSDTSLTYTLRIVAKDGGDKEETATALITVNRNLHSPMFSANKTVSINEDDTLGASIENIQATDLDISAPHNQLEYSLDQTSSLGLFYFTIDADTGDISLIKSLVVSTADTFTLVVKATDKGLPTARVSGNFGYVTVNVQRNKNSPIFFPTTYTAQISERSIVNTEVFTVAASDKDTVPKYKRVRYNLIGDDSAPNYFAVDSDSGSVTTTNSLLQENVDFYNLRIVATDEGSPARSATVLAKISIKRNFFHPVFNPTSYTKTIQVTQAFGVEFVQVTATDQDSQSPHNTVYFELTGNAKAQEFFQVNEQTGQVSVKKSLLTDVDNTARYTLTIEAFDNGNPVLRSDAPPSASVIVDIIRNQNPPQFDQTKYTVNIEQSLPVSDPVIKVSANDPDITNSQDKVKYSIIGLDTASIYFSIDATSGQITLKQSILGDTAIEYQILVEATDSGTSPLTDIATVDVFVNRNMNPPVFQQTVYNINTQESRALGDVIVRVLALDVDTTAPNNQVRYSAVGNQKAMSFFFVNSVTGDVSVKSPLTNDNDDEYQLTIGAEDQAISSYRLTAAINAVVNIKVVRNKFGPVFQQIPYQTTINQFSGNTVSLFRVEATDQDDSAQYNTVTYSIVSEASGSNFFNIDSSTGILKLKASITNDPTSTYRVFVRASDSGSPPRVAYTTVTMTVNRNLATPEWQTPGAPAFTGFATELETVDFAKVIYTVKAFDADQTAPYNQLSYSIVGDDTSLTYFSIDSDTGEIRLRSSLLQDQSLSYQVYVKAEDKGQPPKAAAQTATVTIKVDRNLNTPQFQSIPYFASVNENTLVDNVIFRAAATDADKTNTFETVSFEVVGDDEAPVFFNVDASGAVKVIKDLTTAPDSIYVRLQVKDNGEPVPRSTTTVLIVTILRNFNRPVFTTLTYQKQIPDSTPLGTSVLTVVATDTDNKAPQNEIRYSITESSNQATDFFYIDSVSGVFYVKQGLTLDAVQNTFFQFNVTATDLGTPSMSSTQKASVVITVLRNSFTPSFSPNFIEISVKENAVVTTSIAKLTVNDRDTTAPFDVVTLKAFGDDSATIYFTVSNDSNVTIIRDLTLDTAFPDQYTLRVKATDGGRPGRSSTALIRINIERNFVGPVFGSSSNTQTIPETYPLGSKILQVTATDADIRSPQNQIKYSIEDDGQNNQGYETFLIDSDTAEIFLRSSLLYTSIKRTTYTFNVMARDGGLPQKTMAAPVTITVLRNLQTPSFNQTVYNARIVETLAVDNLVAQFTASDADKPGPFSNLNYDLIGDGNSKIFFKIETLSGEIRVAQLLTTDSSQSTFNLRVRVQDGGTPRLSATTLVTVDVDRNLFPPVFNNLNYQTTILETQAPGEIIIFDPFIRATDRDIAKPYNTMEYFFVNDAGSFVNTRGNFYIEPDLGYILVEKNLVGDPTAKYDLKVVAQDGGNPKRQSQFANVTINIVQNLAAPVFASQSYTKTLRADTSLSTNVIKVTATDTDVQFGLVTYFIIGDDSADQFFAIGRSDGQISVKKSFGADNVAEYRIRVRAQDNGSPSKSDTTVVTVFVTRNLVAPQFVQTNVFGIMKENQVVGATSTKVSCTDGDLSAPNNVVQYSLSNSANVEQFFSVEPLTGTIILIQPLYLDASDATTYTLQVTCSDMGSPPKNAVSAATVTINVHRNLNPPRFLSAPYTKTILSNIGSRASVFQISVTDDDSTSPFNQLTLQVIGDDPGPTFFELGADRVIRVGNVSDLTTDTRTEYTLRILVKDGGTPALTAQVNVDITVNRNWFAPRFTTQNPIVLTLPEATVVGTSVTQVEATDTDQYSPNNLVNYYAVGDNQATDFFFVSPLTGVITLVKPLLNIANTGFVVRIEARDQGSPSLTATSTVQITIQEQTTFQFTQTVYTTSISENKAVNETVLMVLAQPGPGVSYRLTGISSGPDYFAINVDTGLITVRSDLRNDLNRKTLYKLKVEASKTLSTGLRSTIADVNINVGRNQNTPIFSPNALYNARIPETLSLGTSVIQLTASDLDQQDTLHYELIQKVGVTDYFYVSPNSGLISLRSLLEGQTNQQYEFQVRVTDSLVNPNSATATVQVEVVRDNLPVFVNANQQYRTSVNINTAVNSTFYTLTAIDADLVGSITYEATGYGAAPGYFQIDSASGIITVISPLPLSFSSYILGVKAYDSARPDQFAQVNLTISVNRNPTAPVFISKTYQATIKEIQQLGEEVVKISASDSDQQSIGYDIVSSNPTEGTNFFSLGATSGSLTVIKPLYETSTRSFIFVVRATDDGIPPRSNQETANIIVTVLKNNHDPQFSSSLQFKLDLIQESDPVGTVIEKVTATDNDQVPEFSTLTYSLIGLDKAPNYFKINSTTGELSVKTSLIPDAETRYMVNIQARDGGMPSRTATTLFTVWVARNDFAPVYNPTSYSETIPEATDVGSSVLQVTATDGDNGDVITFEIDDTTQNGRIAKEFFYVNPASGAVFVKKDLKTTTETRFDFSVKADDDGYPLKSTSTAVVITVIRDLAPPRFTQSENVRTVPDTNPVNAVVFTFTATDDVQNRVMYEAIGDGPALGFFTLNSTTGEVRVRNSLLRGSDSQYILIVNAYDSFFKENTAVGKLTINVVRNPNAPFFTPANYNEQIIEYFRVGIPVLTVAATDGDQDTIIYTLELVNNCLDQFYISPTTGVFALKKSLSDSTTNQYSCRVKASDQRGRVSYADVTITVVRVQAPTFFGTPPFSAPAINDNVVAGTSVFAVTASISDPQGSVVYEVTGDVPTPSYFSVNSSTGMISARQGLDLDTNLNYKLVIDAYNSLFPQKRTSAVVNIVVIRNKNTPVFNPSAYNEQITEDFGLGQSITTVTARDDDNDVLRYTLLGDTTAQENFYLNPDTGEVYLIKNLLQSSSVTFNLRIQASDQGNPEKTHEATLTIRVVRNQFPPSFVGTNFDKTLLETTGLGASVFAVTCQDNDLKGKILYESIGVYPAQSFFSINSTTGEVTIAQSLKSDSFARAQYTLAVVCYDSRVPTQRVQKEIRFDVLRNQNSPIFNATSYTTQVDEDYPQNQAVITVGASDPDSDTVVYAITRDIGGGNSLSYFFIDRLTGQIFLRQPLIGAKIDTFIFVVTATDSGRPPQTKEVNCVVNVKWDKFNPKFVGEPFSKQINENALNNSVIMKISAVDQDLTTSGQSGVAFMVVGVAPAPSFFKVDINGNVLVRGDLRTDRNMEYTLRVQAYDPASPSRKAETDVIISVLRNINPPSFSQRSYLKSIPETTLIGTSIISVLASDSDGDTLVYTMSVASCLDVFYLGPASGVLYLKKPLEGRTEQSFTCQVSVSDNGYPVPRTDSGVTVSVIISRDTNVPVFTNNGQYSVTTQENKLVGTPLVTVSASRSNAVAQIVYKVVGDYPSPSFFMVNSTTGVVSIMADLQTDNLDLASYTLRISAYDTGVPQLTAEAEVFVQVTRNLNGPEFFPKTYQVTIPENEPKGTLLQKLTVADADGDPLSCSIVNASPYFEIDSQSCLVKLKTSLTSDPQRQRQYNIQIVANDQKQSATAQMTVNVLRDMAVPRFTNLPGNQAIDETTIANSTIFKASAIDADLQGIIMYKLVGVFPAQTFFLINSTNGDIFLRNSLKSDFDARLSYKIRIQAYDTAYPTNIVEADLTLSVIRNKNGPRFTKQLYTFTVADTLLLGGTVGSVTATDDDGDQVILGSEATGNSADLFYLNFETGVISLRQLLPTVQEKQFEFIVTATDERPANIYKQARSTVKVIVVGNSGPPIFSGTPYSTNVPINKPVNSSVFSVSATKPDLKGSLVYRLDGYEPDTSYFSLNTADGTITLKQSLIPGSNPFTAYTLLITAYDTGIPEIESTEQVQINILRNLNAPVFNPTTYIQSIFDYQAVGTFVLQVTATDIDITSPENSFVFEIQSGSDANNFFSINPFSGIITVRQSLAQSTQDSYSFQVVAKDLGSSPRTTTAQVNIALGRNGSPPQFINTHLYNKQVLETVSVLETILQVSAQDSDSAASLYGQIRFSIVGPADALAFFQIDPVSGNITSRVSLTTAPINQYTLTVRATDQGIRSRSSEASAIITIQREGNPTFSQSEYSVSKSESMQVDDLIIQVLATDPLKKDLVYEITGDGPMVSTLFRINPQDGIIRLAQSLKTDSANIYVIRVTASRAEDATVKATTVVRMSVTRNINLPIFSHGNLRYALSEDQLLGAVIGQVNASDADAGKNGKLIFSIDGPGSNPSNSDQYFFINPNTGEFAVSKKLRDDPNQPDAYVLRIVATDQGFPPRSSSNTVTVTVQRNKFGPIFVRQEYVLSLNENTAAGFNVLTVVATDQDGDAVAYSLIGSLPGTLYFEINSDTGVIKTKESIVSDTSTVYRLRVEAVDRPAVSVTPRSSVAEVTFNIIRNVNSPAFVKPVYDTEISEYTGLRDIIVTVVANDNDSPQTPSGTIRYSLVNVVYIGSNALTIQERMSWFVVSRSGGTVELDRSLTNNVAPSSFVLTIEASDSASLPKTAVATVNIQITRNQHAPLFTSQSYSANIDTLWAIGKPILTVSANDADVNVTNNKNTRNAEFDYIIDPNNRVARTFFDITNTGLLYLKNTLQSENSAVFSFSVLASDRSWKPLSSRAPVNISVTKKDNGNGGNNGGNVPEPLGFKKDLVLWTVTENEVGNPKILEVGNALNSVTCKMVAVNGIDIVGVSNYPFDVRTASDGKNCEVYFRTGMDYEQADQYDITVMVSEVNSNGRKKRQITPNVPGLNQNMTLLLRVTDVNDNIPVWIYPSYPSGISGTFVFAISEISSVGTIAGRIEATDQDPGLGGLVSYSKSGVVPFILSTKQEVILSENIYMSGLSEYRFMSMARDGISPFNQQSTNIVVKLIKEDNRFVLSVDKNYQDVKDRLEDYRKAIQQSSQKVAIIETVREKLVINNDDSLRFDKAGTDITFVLAEPNNNLELVINAAVNTADIATSASSNLGVPVSINLPKSLSDYSLPADVKAAFSIGSALTRTVRVKSYTWWSYDPWLGLLVIAVLVFVTALVAVIVLLNTYNKFTKVVKQFRAHDRYMRDYESIEPRFYPREYETRQNGRNSASMSFPVEDKEFSEIVSPNAKGMQNIPIAANTSAGAGAYVNPAFGEETLNPVIE